LLIKSSCCVKNGDKKACHMVWSGVGGNLSHRFASIYCPALPSRTTYERKSVVGGQISKLSLTGF
jgi:hypothetical protein